MFSSFEAALLALALATSLEVLLSATWNRYYFCVGIPIFFATRQTSAPLQEPVSPNLLQASFQRSIFPPILFQPLDLNTMAFRERFWCGLLRVHYTPVMHGLLEIVPNRGIRVRGYLNWCVVFLVATFWVSFGEIFVVPLLAALYLVQAARYRSVANRAVALLRQV